MPTAPRDYSPIPEDWHEDSSSRPFSPFVIIIAVFAWIIIGLAGYAVWRLFA